MRRSLLLTGLSLLLLNSTLGQRTVTDSLFAELKRQGEDTTRVKLLNQLSFEYHRVDPDSAINLADLAIKLAKELGYTKGQAHALRLRGLGYYAKGKYETAIENSQESIALFERLNDQQGISECLLSLGSTFYRQSQFEKSYDHFERAYLIAEKAGDKKNMARTLNNMGAVQKVLGNMNLALEYFERSLPLKIETGTRPRSIASTLTNIGNIYTDQQEFEKALRYYERSLKMKLKANDRTGEAVVLNNMGIAHISLGRNQEGLRSYLKALQINQELGQDCEAIYSLCGVAEAYMNLGYHDSTRVYGNKALIRTRRCEDRFEECNVLIVMGSSYFQTNALTKAESVLMDAYFLAIELQVPVERKKASYLLYQVYKEKGAYDLALKFHEIYKVAYDSVFDQQNIKKLAQLESKFEFEKEKQQLLLLQQQEEQLLQAEIKQQQVIQYALLGGGILFLALFINFYLSFKRKKRDNGLIIEQNAKLQELSNFKEGLTGMIAHDMKNSLNTIIGYSASEPFDKKMQGINQSGRSLLNLVTNMLDLQRFEEASVIIKPTVTRLDKIVEEARLEVALLFQMKSVRLVLDVPDHIMLKVDHDLIVRVLVNLLSNAVKYSESGKTVVLNVTTTEEHDWCQIKVVDEGEGIPAKDLTKVFDRFWQSNARKSGQAAATGLGLAFCKLAVEAHRGEISVESIVDEGSVFTVGLPILEVDAQSHSYQDNPEEQLILDSEREAILAASQHLRSLEIFQIGQIYELLDQLEKKGIRSRWKQELANAVHRADEEAYLNLVRTIDEFKSS